MSDQQTLPRASGRASQQRAFMLSLHLNGVACSQWLHRKVLQVRDAPHTGLLIFEEGKEGGRERLCLAHWVHIYMERDTQVPFCSLTYQVLCDSGPFREELSSVCQELSAAYTQPLLRLEVSSPSISFQFMSLPPKTLLIPKLIPSSTKISSRTLLIVSGSICNTRSVIFE